MFPSFARSFIKKVHQFGLHLWAVEHFAHGLLHHFHRQWRILHLVAIDIGDGYILWLSGPAYPWHQTRTRQYGSGGYSIAFDRMKEQET